VVVRTQLNAELLLDTAPGEVQVLDPSEDIVEADAVDDETAAESAAEDTAKVRSLHSPPSPSSVRGGHGGLRGHPRTAHRLRHKATLLFIP